MLIDERDELCMNSVVVSIVSHDHGEMVSGLVRQLLDCFEVRGIVVTCNVPEVINLPDDERVSLINNLTPKGFSANHNAAFKKVAGDAESLFFCPVNPDVRLQANPFPALLSGLNEKAAVLAAPLVVGADALVEDSHRRFPTLRSLFSKALGGADGRYSVVLGQPDFHPEWVAGMFMLFRAESFRQLGGFDERFFLYYEDVDICVRAWKQGFKIVACPSAVVVHDARRDSRRKLRFMVWHLSSLTRYFRKHWLRLPTVSAS
jgi:GT2 family glycosyltransferase